MFTSLGEINMLWVCVTATLLGGTSITWHQLWIFTHVKLHIPQLYFGLLWSEDSS